MKTVGILARILEVLTAILSSWYLLFRVCRDSIELSVSLVWYSSSSVSSSGVRGLNLFWDVILFCSCLRVLGLGFWSCSLVLQCYSVCWHLVTRVLRIFHLLAQLCSVLGSGQQVLGSRGVSVLWEVDKSDELDFLLRRVEQAFTSKIKLENEVIVKQVFQVEDLLLTR